MSNLGDGDLWEYNAPQFVDFTADDDESHNADAWFDIDHENEATQEEFVEDTQGTVCEGMEIVDADEVAAHITPNVESTDSSPAKYHSAPSSPDKQGKGKKTPRSTKKEEMKKPRNLCTSLSEWRNATKNLQQQNKSHPSVENNKKGPHSINNKKSSSVLGDKSKDVKSEAQKHHKRSLDTNYNDKNEERKTRRSCNQSATATSNKSTTRRSASRSDSAHSSSSKGLKRAESAGRLGTVRNTIKRSNSSVRLNASESKAETGPERRRTRSSAQPISTDSLSKFTRPRSGSTSSHNDSIAPSSKMPKLTVPTTPTVLKRKPTKIVTDKTKNSEETELEQIAYLRQQLSKKRKMAEQSYKKAMTSGGYAPVQAKIEPTKPLEFHFQTDSRIKSHTSEPSHDESRQDFQRILRSSTKPSSQCPANKGLTKPQPFSLTESRKRKLSGDSEPSEKYHSMAEKLRAFHKQTPDRFKSKPKTEGPHTRNRSHSPGSLTVPKTPNLETRGRSRPVHIPSRQEVEDQEVEEIKRHQFKANPVNQKIMNNPNTGVRKVPTKAPTEPEEFHLGIEKRIQDREFRKTTQEEKYEFHAQPVPKKILEGTVGIKPAKELPLTHPQSPAFALKHRVRLPMEQPEEKEVERQMRKAHPVPHMGVPFQPKLSHECTKPEPFAFEERNKLAASRKEERIKEVLEEEKKAREFHAMPLPDHSVDLPPKKVKPATKPEPFKLEIDARGAKRADEWSQKMEEEIRQKRSQVQFKAKPALVTQKEPFMAQKSTKALTDISEFTLNTERRSQQRDAFEMSKKAREAELEGARRQRERDLEEEEKATIAKLRMEMVHKPNPIKKFKSVEILSSDKPLTIAESPQFNTDRRLRSKVRI